MPAVDWIEALRAECVRTSQAQAARRIGRSAAVVNQVLKGTYKGNLRDVEARVRGALMRATLACPVLGEIPTNRCLDEQARPRASTNPLRVALYRACQTCPNRRKP
ncbi:MAG: XRE family transcriptional regulator [Betaproteobacteria bacterium]|nr:XRE family transcriptional regulator [Betaproteobacteria bacterium]